MITYIRNIHRYISGKNVQNSVWKTVIAQQHMFTADAIGKQKENSRDE